jgi:hypothetical protein
MVQAHSEDDESTDDEHPIVDHWYRDTAEDTIFQVGDDDDDGYRRLCYYGVEDRRFAGSRFRARVESGRYLHLGAKEDAYQYLEVGAWFFDRDASMYLRVTSVPSDLPAEEALQELYDDMVPHVGFEYASGRSGTYSLDTFVGSIREGAFQPVNPEVRENAEEILVAFARNELRHLDTLAREDPYEQIGGEVRTIADVEDALFFARRRLEE